MDISYLLALQSFREATNGVFTAFFSKVTLLGESLLPVIMVLCIYWCIDKSIGGRAILGYGMAGLANGLAKLTACVYRPWIRSEAIHPESGALTKATGYSFPSGHTTNATATWGNIGWQYRRQSRLLMVVLFVIVALVMLSRNYLGVHTPQDVLVGLTLTVLVVALTNRLTDWMEAGRNRDLIVLAGAAAVIALGIVYVMNKPYPMDYDAAGKLIVDPKAMQPDTFGGFGSLLGCLAGWIFERRAVRFSNDATFAQKCARLAVGAMLYLLLRTTCRSLVLLVIADKNIAYFIGTAFTMFAVVGLYPMAFKAWEK